MPVMSSFLGRMRDAVDWLEANGRAEEKESIERVLDFRHESSASGYRVNIDLDNIEHLFSLAAARAGSTTAHDIGRAIAATLDYSAQTSIPAEGRLRVIEANGWPCTAPWCSAARRVTQAAGAGEIDVESSIYDLFISMLSGLAANKTERGKNVVISLNYDLLVEEAARRLNIPIDYGLGDTDVALQDDAATGSTAAFQVLKLHGSINWAQRDGMVLVCRDYERVRSQKLAPLLLPPTWHKNLATPFIRVWDAAIRAIASATRLIIVGFSMPVSDQHFKYLLAAGLKENSSLRSVRIIDPHAIELRHQYETVFREDMFNYGIVSLCPTTANVFFLDEAEIAAIGRELAHPGLSLVADDRRERRIVRR